MLYRSMLVFHSWQGPPDWTQGLQPAAARGCHYTGPILTTPAGEAFVPLMFRCHRDCLQVNRL